MKFQNYIINVGKYFHNFSNKYFYHVSLNQNQKILHCNLNKNHDKIIYQTNNPIYQLQISNKDKISTYVKIKFDEFGDIHIIEIQQGGLKKCYNHQGSLYFLNKRQFLQNPQQQDNLYISNEDQNVLHEVKFENILDQLKILEKFKLVKIYRMKELNESQLCYITENKSYSSVIEDLKKEIEENVVTEDRKNHIYGVYQYITKLQKQFNLDVKKCQIVQLSHDLFKEKENDAMKYFVRKFKIPLTDKDYEDINKCHGKISAYYVRDKYGDDIIDKEVFDQIHDHMHYKKGMKMSNIQKQMVIQDNFEKNRLNEDAEIFRDNIKNINDMYEYINNKTNNKFFLQQLRKGIEIEKEHTDDPKIALKIQLDHLQEYPDYYDRLEKMESKQKDYWNDKKSDLKSVYEKQKQQLRELKLK